MPATPPESPASQAAPKPRPMPLWRRLRIWLAGGACLVVVALVVAGTLLYRAATAASPEYEALLTRLEALEDSGELDTQRQEFESQVAALYSNAQAEPRWRLVVTEEQLNSWLAMQLPIDFPELERQGIQKPRVLLADGAATLACRARVRGVETVASIALAPMVSEGGWIGFELQSIKVGRLPLPAAAVVERFDDAVQAAGATPEELRCRWSEANGNPVLLLDLERLASSDDRLRRIDAVEVRDGELFLGGVTEQREAAPADGPALPVPSE